MANLKLQKLGNFKHKVPWDKNEIYVYYGQRQWRGVLNIGDGVWVEQEKVLGENWGQKL